MVKNSENSSRWIPLVAALVVATSFLLLYRDYQSKVEHHREVMLARGQTVLDALTAGIRAQGRMGRYRPERLSAVFEELAETPDIVGLELRTQEGTIISSGGDTQDLSEVKPTAPLWYEGRLVMVCEPLLLSHGPGRGLGYGPGQGRGRGWPGEMDDWEPFPSGPYFLTATLDTSAMLEETRGDRLRFIGSAGVTLVAVVLGALFMLARVKQRDLSTALLVAQERTAQQEHLTRLGAGLAHETKNPLGIVRGQAQLISGASDSPESYHENKRRAEKIVDEIDRTVGQINSFLTLARPKEVKSASVNLDEFFEAFLPLVNAESNQKDVQLIYTKSGLTIRADRELLRRAMLNVVVNAFHACEAKDRIQITAEKPGRTVSLAVSDTGCGIAPEDLNHVTEPYFTRFEGGCGLGLSLVKQIALAHGWELRIESDLGKGTRVSLDGIDEGKRSGT